MYNEVNFGHKQTLREFVAEILEEQEAKGREMLADSDFTDMFHPGGPHNVGQDALDAVANLRGAIEATLVHPECRIDDLLSEKARHSIDGGKAGRRADDCISLIYPYLTWHDNRVHFYCAISKGIGKCQYPIHR